MRWSWGVVFIGSSERWLVGFVASLWFYMPTFCQSRSANFPVTAVLAFFCWVGTSCAPHRQTHLSPRFGERRRLCVGTALNCIDSLHAFRKVDVVCLPCFVANHGSERSPSSCCMPGKDDCCALAGSEDFLCGYMLALIHHIISLSSFMWSETQDTLVWHAAEKSRDRLKCVQILIGSYQVLY